jgi:tetratricopeptide (TPR) repeat protein
MRKILYLFLLMPFSFYAQPNCKAYLYTGDTAQYKACLLSEQIQEYQFDRKFHEKFDEALAICPHYAYAYREQSTAYLKSRGWCRYQFFRDYDGAIKDLEKLDSLANYDIGYSQNGHYHLNIAKGMCYSAIGQKQKAIEIFQSQINTPNYEAGLFDYYQLGVTYFEVKDYQNALICFEKQAKINPLAETEYYRGKIYKILKNQIEADKYKELAVKLYKENKNLFDPYTHHFNKVYLTEIEKE